MADGGGQQTRVTDRHTDHATSAEKRYHIAAIMFCQAAGGGLFQTHSSGGDIVPRRLPSIGLRSVSHKPGGPVVAPATLKRAEVHPTTPICIFCTASHIFEFGL